MMHSSLWLYSRVSCHHPSLHWAHLKSAVRKIIVKNCLNWQRKFAVLWRTTKTAAMMLSRKYWPNFGIRIPKNVLSSLPSVLLPWSIWRSVSFVSLSSTKNKWYALTVRSWILNKKQWWATLPRRTVRLAYSFPAIVVRKVLTYTTIATSCSTMIYPGAWLPWSNEMAVSTVMVRSNVRLSIT